MLRITLLFISLILSQVALSQKQFFSQYDKIYTIAGKGEISEKEYNCWKKTYERQPAKDAELSRPHFAMADKAGYIYIADKDAHAIRRVDPETNKIYTVAGINRAGYNGDKRADKTELDQPNGLYVLPDGTFYILDLGNNRIRKVDTKGNLTTIVHDEEGIESGRGLWVSSTEDTVIYSSGKELKIWTSSEGLRVYADGFMELGNICVDPQGNLYATDRGSGKLFKLEKSTGKVLHIAGNGKDKSDKGKNNPVKRSLNGLRAVWYTEDGGLLLGCHEDDDIYYLSATGKIFKFIDGSKNDHAEDHSSIYDGKVISETRSISVDYKGNIIICENDAGYVRIIKKQQE